MKPLTQQQAREFIAEKSGWEKIKHHWIHQGIALDLPDYFNADDHEALYWLHLAEEALSEQYSSEFRGILVSDLGIPDAIHATAPQRARAFCQVFGFSVEGVG